MNVVLLSVGRHGIIGTYQAVAQARVGLDDRLLTNNAIFKSHAIKMQENIHLVRTNAYKSNTYFSSMITWSISVQLVNRTFGLITQFAPMIDELIDVFSEITV